MALETIMWFRDDLRLIDNDALTWAVQTASEKGTTLLPVFIHEVPTDHAVRPLGQAAYWWQQTSLVALREDLKAHGLPLLELVGDPVELVPAIARALNASAVAWCRRYDLPRRSIDAEVKAALAKSEGTEVHSFPGYLLTEPWEVQTTTGGGYKVFTPFSKKAMGFVADCLDGVQVPSQAPDFTAVAPLNTALEEQRSDGFAPYLEEMWSQLERGGVTIRRAQ